MNRILLLGLLLGTFSCMQFRLPEVEMNKILETNKGKIQSDTLFLGDQAMHYVYTNRGHDDLVVFIHGSPGSWNAFLDFMITDSLLNRYDMVSIDRPGYGYSDYGYAEPSLKKQADLINEVMKQFKQEHRIFVGHSLGGPVIARMAMDYPQMVQAMVFVAPSIDPQLEHYEWYRTWIDTKLGDLVTPTDFWVSNEEILPLKGELTKMLPLWKTIRVPSIVIQGTNDSFVPKENAEFAHEMLGDSLVTIWYLEGVNHFIPWSHPQKIVEAIEELR